MTLVAGRDYFRCDYCHSFHFPPGAGDDGVRLVDGLTGLDCPVCLEHLQNGRIEGEPVQYCPKCRGFLSTNPVFATIVRQRRTKRPVSDSTHSFCPEELKRSVKCPQCQNRMDTHPFYGGGRVVVDTCPVCALIWLDAGELTVIERHNPPPLVSPLPPPPVVTSSDDVGDALGTFFIVPW
jgi:Zn-finger nucleic acid-binding protein